MTHANVTDICENAIKRNEESHAPTKRSQLASRRHRVLVIRIQGCGLPATSMTHLSFPTDTSAAETVVGRNLAIVHSWTAKSHNCVAGAI